MMYSRSVATTAFVFAGMAAALASGECVKVSQFGFDPEDSTRFVQAALDSGAKKVVFDRQKSSWVTLPLQARSNTEIVFEDGVELLAKRGGFHAVRGDCLLSLECVSNVTIRGIGKGGRLRMWIKDYHTPEYRKSEWRHALNILSSSNITVERMAFVESGGDGIYIGEKQHGRTNRDIVIRDCVCDSNNRQGISVITVDGLLVERTVMSNTYGTPPKAGIDFEPNASHQMLRRIVMRSCLSQGNEGKGYEFYLAKFNDKTEPIDALFEDCRSVGDRRGGFVLAMGKMTPGKTVPRGMVTVRNCSFESSPASGIAFCDKTIDAPRVVFENCTVKNSPSDPESKARPVYFLTRTFWTPPIDGVEFRNLKVIPSGPGDWHLITAFKYLKPVKDISGDIHIERNGVVRTEVIDRKWLDRNFPQLENKDDLRVTPFDHLRDWKVVDSKPGKMSRFEKFNLRFRGKAVFYADSKRSVSLEGVFSTMPREKKKIKVKPFVVRDMKGNRIASLKMFDTKKCVRRFNVPAKGFYEIEWDVDRSMLSFTACDAPFAIAPSRDGVDIYRSTGTFYIPHRAGSVDTVICGGGGAERANIRLAAPSGTLSAAWDSLGASAFKRIDEAGVWRLSFSRPTKGVFEDTFATVVGDSPSLFFLTTEKYWE